MCLSMLEHFQADPVMIPDPVSAQASDHYHPEQTEQRQGRRQSQERVTLHVDRAQTGHARDRAAGTAVETVRTVKEK